MLTHRQDLITLMPHGNFSHGAFFILPFQKEKDNMSEVAEMQDAQPEQTNTPDFEPNAIYESVGEEFVEPDEYEGTESEETEDVEETTPAQNAETPDDKVKTLEQQLKKEIADKNRAFQEKRQLEKRIKEAQANNGEQPLTREQLKSIFKEHKDDEDVVFNILDYYMEQNAKKTSNEAIDAVKLSQMKTHTDTYVSREFPALLNEESDVYRIAQETKDQFGLSNNPHSDFLVGHILRSMNTKNFVEQAYQKGLEDGKYQKAESKRKQNVGESKLEKTEQKDSNGKGQYSAKDMDVFNILNLKTDRQKEIYRKLTSKKGKK